MRGRVTHFIVTEFDHDESLQGTEIAFVACILDGTVVVDVSQELTMGQILHNLKRILHRNS